MSRHKFRLLCDSRESEKTIRTLRQLYPSIVVTRLKLGDIATDKVVIEHKTVTDLIASLLDGRLYKQAPRLAQDGRLSQLLVSGTPKEAEAVYHRAINWKMVVGSLVSVYVRYGLPTIWVPDLRHAMYFGIQICEKVQEGKLGLPRLNIYKRRVKVSPRVRVLMRGFGLSKRVAEASLKKFGSVKAFVSASEQRLQAVRGIGPVRAKTIAKLVK